MKAACQWVKGSVVDAIRHSDMIIEISLDMCDLAARLPGECDAELRTVIDQLCHNLWSIRGTLEPFDS